MTDLPISELPTIAAAGDDDEMVIVDTGLGTTHKISLAALATALGLGDAEDRGPLVSISTVTYDQGSGTLTIALTDGREIETSSLIGAMGAQGPRGEDGASGSQGDQGMKGDTGEQGPSGADGDDGAAGARGPKGDKGEKGDTGDTGPAGEDGSGGGGTELHFRNHSFSGVGTAEDQIDIAAGAVTKTLTRISEASSVVFNIDKSTTVSETGGRNLPTTQDINNAVIHIDFEIRIASTNRTALQRQQLVVLDGSFAGDELGRFDVEFGDNKIVLAVEKNTTLHFRYEWQDSRPVQMNASLMLGGFSITDEGPLHEPIITLINNEISKRNPANDISDLSSLVQLNTRNLEVVRQITDNIDLEPVAVFERIGFQIKDDPYTDDLDPADDSINNSTITPNQFLYVQAKYIGVFISAGGDDVHADLIASRGDRTDYFVYRLHISSDTRITVWQSHVVRRLAVIRQIEANAAAIEELQGDLSLLRNKIDANEISARQRLALTDLTSYLTPATEIGNLVDGVVVKVILTPPQESTPASGDAKTQHNSVNLPATLNNLTDTADLTFALPVKRTTFRGTHPTDRGDFFQKIEMAGWIAASDYRDKVFILKIDWKLYADHVTKNSRLVDWTINFTRICIDIRFKDIGPILFINKNDIFTGNSESSGTTDIIQPEKRHTLSVALKVNDAGDLVDISFHWHRHDNDQIVNLNTLSFDTNTTWDPVALRSMIIGSTDTFLADDSALVWGDADRTTGSVVKRLDLNPPEYTTASGHRREQTEVQATGVLALLNDRVDGDPQADFDWETGVDIDATTHNGSPCPKHWFAFNNHSIERVCIKYRRYFNVRRYFRIWFTEPNLTADDLFPLGVNFDCFIGYYANRDNWNDIRINVNDQNQDDFTIVHEDNRTYIQVEIPASQELPDLLPDVSTLLLKELSVLGTQYLGGDSVVFPGQINKITWISAEKSLFGSTYQEFAAFANRINAAEDSDFYRLPSGEVLSLGGTLTAQKDELEYVANSYVRGFSDTDENALYTIKRDDNDYEEYYITYTKNTTVSAHNGVSFIDRVDFITIPSDTQDLVFQGQGRGTFNFGATAWLSDADGALVEGAEPTHITFAVYDLNSNSYIERIDPPPSSITGTSLSGVKIEGVRRSIK